MHPISAYYIGDDATLLALYTYILREAKYSVESTTNLTRGFEYCQTKPPDVLVIEHNASTTEWSSIALYHQLRNTLTTATLPILVIRCERQAARQEYTTEADPRLSFLPIVITVEEFLTAIEKLVSSG